tara:strand:- start:296 stop:1519 length:1224 start_codon:yes stop_codon:yes gene_type:complete
MKTDDGALLTLQTSDTDVTANDVLGVLQFQAPNDETGTDAIIVSAAIAAVAEDTFAADNNKTKLSFRTGASEVAAEKMALDNGGDLKIVTDGASIFFGADSEIELRHVADDGLILKHVGTGDGKEPSLTFQAGDNDIAVNDLLGAIYFQAPDEGAGTDAVLVAAGIEAVSEGDFAADNNATKLSFKTGASEAATEKMALSSAGVLSAIDLDISGDVDVDGTLETDAFTIAGVSVLPLPAGSLMPYAGSSAPTGYLLCYGQAVSRSTYAALFTAISTTYGSGDGSSTFNLPDLRGRVVAGQDDMGGSSANRLTSQSGDASINGDTLGAAGGKENHTLAITEMAEHSHLPPTTALQNGADVDGLSGAGTGVNSSRDAGPMVNEDGSSVTGGSSHNNVQPTIILNYIIKT